MQKQYNKNFVKKIHCKCNMFTLLELLLVISIIAILSGLLQPVLFKSKERAKYAKWLVYTKNIQSDPSLVGQWTFDGDELGQNTAQGFSVDFYTSKEYNAKVFGTLTTNKGRWGKKALYFLGNNNSYLQIDDGALYNPGKGDMTMIVWFRSTTNNKRFILCKGEGRNRNHPGWVFHQNRTFRMRAYSLDNQKFKNGRKDRIELDKWHFAALVIDNSNKQVRMYFDDKMIYSKAIKVKGSDGQTADFTAPDKCTLIGIEQRGKNKICPFRGYIDEVEIFKRALTPAEIKQFYDVGSRF